MITTPDHTTRLRIILQFKHPSCDGMIVDAANATPAEDE